MTCPSETFHRQMDIFFLFQSGDEMHQILCRISLLSVVFFVTAALCALTPARAEIDAIPTFPALIAILPKHQAQIPVLTFAELKPSELSSYRALWRGLSEADKPPIPTKGFSELFSVLRQHAEYVDANETLILIADLDQEGRVHRVRSVRYESDQLLKRAIWAVVDTDFSPALCAGVPCWSTIPVVVKVPR